MSTFDVKQDIGSVQTVAEFEQLLVNYKKQHPEQYDIKLANGEFDRFRKTLKDYVPVEEPKVDSTAPSVPVEEPKINKKTIELKTKQNEKT